MDTFADGPNTIGRGRHVLDVLEQLPRDVLRDNIWLHLKDESLRPGCTLNGLGPGAQIGRALRVASHACEHLTSQLTRRLHLVCDQGPHGAAAIRPTRTRQCGPTARSWLATEICRSSPSLTSGTPMAATQSSRPCCWGAPPASTCDSCASRLPVAGRKPRRRLCTCTAPASASWMSPLTSWTQLRLCSHACTSATPSPRVRLGVDLDAGFDTVCQLSSLTRLACAGVAKLLEEADEGGCLPLLQHLEIVGSVSGKQLAATLQRLRPLAQLRQLACTLELEQDSEEAWEDEGNDGGRDAAWQTGTYLAAAPGLHRISLTLGSTSNSTPALVGPAVALLAHLGLWLTTLRLDSLPRGAMDALWPALCQAPRLHMLSLDLCRVRRAWLLSLVKQSPALRRLQVRPCLGEMDEEDAMALVAALVWPLHLVWEADDGLTDAAFLQLRAVAAAGVTVGDDWQTRDQDGF